MDPLADLALTRGGPWVLVALTVIALIRGWLVPRSTLTDVRADRDARVTEAREDARTWRAAAEVERERGRVRDDQVEELLEMSRTTAEIWQAIQRLAGRRTPGGEAV